MKRINLRKFLTGILLLGFLLTLGGCTEGLAVGGPAPDFNLYLVNWQEKTISRDQLRGYPIVIAFWTTWCPHCEAQQPYLIDAARRYSKAVIFLGVDVQEDERTVKNYLSENPLPYPVAVDPMGVTAGDYEVSGFPTTYFVDAEGNIAAVHVGELTEESLENYLQELIK